MVAVRTLILVAGLLFAARALAEEAPAKETHVISEKELVDDDGYAVRVSLPTESDVEAWSHPGLRIALGYSHGQLWGNGPSLKLSMDAFTLRALARLDKHWSVGLDFQYALAQGTGVTGLRFGSTVLAILHPWRQLGIGVGVGYGGLILVPPNGPASTPGTGQEVSTTTFGPEVKLGECSGGAWVGQARIEYPFVIGPLFASGPFVEADAQLTRCQQVLGRVDRETGNPIYGQQWWRNLGGSLGWWLSWR